MSETKNSGILDNPLRTEKRRKSRELKAQGINAFPYKFERIRDLLANSKRFWASDSRVRKNLRMSLEVAGRIDDPAKYGKSGLFQSSGSVGISADLS
jgi:lysyl-tRNA synthetase class II